MKKQILKWLAAGALAAGSSVASFGQPFGQWDFDDPANPLKSTTGPDMGFLDTATEAGTELGSTADFGISGINNETARVMKFPATEFGGFTLPVPVEPNGGGFLVNDYALVMDVLFPAASSGVPRSILDVDFALISPDSEFFITADNALGLKGYSFGQVTADTWHRIGFVVRVVPGGTSVDLHMYIDGTEVGVRKSAAPIDDRFALAAGGYAALFYDDDGETATGFVNSIQLWDRPLSSGEMRALGGPEPGGLPEELPPVPSGILRWTPAGEFTSRTASVGAVIDLGSTTVADSSIELMLNGVPVANPQITREDQTIKVLSPAQALIPGKVYTNTIAYTDSLNGAQEFSHIFTAAIFYEDFDGLVLGSNVDETAAGSAVWTNVPPAGWQVDNTNMAGFGSPDDDGDGWPDGDGVTEWFGWAFADKEWWVRAAEDQRRSEFILSSGNAAITDPDEWDDQSHAQGLYNSVLTTPEIDVAGFPANTVFLRFASSWRPEARDDGPPGFPEGNINNQTARITVSYDGGAPVEVMRWDSVSGSPTFHSDNPNESVFLQLNNPEGVESMVLTFALLDGANDWWWAVDNITVSAGAARPQVVQNPAGTFVSEHSQVTLEVGATGTEPFSYQWKRDGTDIPGATSRTLVLNDIEAAEQGTYSVVVSNEGGSTESAGALVEVFSGPVTEGLVLHLNFNDTLADATGRGNNGTAVGNPQFVDGPVGKAVQVASGADYVSLGTPADLNFGTDVDFSISFWAQINGLAGDPPIISNKDWGSGGNQGYAIFTEEDRRIDWNLSGPPGSRKDSDGVTGVFQDNTWAHIVVTFNRDGNAVTYVNGNLVDRVSLAGNITDLSTAAGLATHIGQDGTGAYGSSFSDLKVDDLGIWRRVVTPQEVFAIYQAGNDGEDLTQAVFAGAEVPVITVQPVNVTAVTGFGATFNVTASGTPPLAYQWQLNGVDLAGATSSTLTLENVSEANVGTYTVIVSNPAGSVTSSPATLTVTAAPTATVIGQWNFNNQDLSAIVGEPLAYRGNIGAATTFDAMMINGQEARVMGFPAASPEGGYIMPTGGRQNGGGEFLNLYTLIMDVMFPAASDATWRGLLQTSESNANDADLFINPDNGIGISGNYTGTIQADTWHRIAFVVNTADGTLRKFIDGEFVGEQAIDGLDGRFSLGATALLFTDEGNETAAGFVNGVQLLDWVVSDEEIAALGQPTADGIPAPVQNDFSLTISNAGGSPVVTVNQAGLFQLQRRSDLNDAEWTNVGEPGSGPFNITVEGNAGFYRVVKQ